MIKNYEIDKFGVIHQIKYDNYLYNIDYVKNRYDKYGDLNRKMSYLRLGNIIGGIGYVPSTILDVGYGNGDFLKLCCEIINCCYGNDISNYQIPDNCEFIYDICSMKFDVITFFDALEHFHDINIISNLKCNFIIISVPWCHNVSDEWFLEWKHRRPNEHLHHFNKNSLINFMNFHGFECISISNVEDIIRKSIDGRENILTGIFKNKKI